MDVHRVVVADLDTGRAVNPRLRISAPPDPTGAGGWRSRTIPAHAVEVADEDEEEFGGDWIFDPVPWREISDPGPNTEEPLVDAWWHGTRVVVVAPSVIEEWMATARAAFFPTADIDAQVIDLPATFAGEGLVGLLALASAAGGRALGSGRALRRHRRLRLYRLAARAPPGPA